MLSNETLAKLDEIWRGSGGEAPQVYAWWYLINLPISIFRRMKLSLIFRSSLFTASTVDIRRSHD